MKQILESTKASSPRVLYPFLFAAAYTGVRRSEILKLKRADIDFQMGLIHFRNTKNGEDRSIRIPKSLQDFLKEHLASHDSYWAFPDPEGEMLGRQRLQRVLRRFKKHFPIGKNWGPHSLRHSFAYNYLKLGGQMYQQPRTFVMSDELVTAVKRINPAGDFVFTSLEGRPLYMQSFVRELRRFQKQMKLEATWSLRDLRDSHAAHFLQTGGSIRSLQKIMGHATPYLTEQVYGKYRVTDAGKFFISEAVQETGAVSES